MPKRIASEELDAIAAVVARHPNGVAAEGVRDGLSFELAPRTMQRRLNLLEQVGRIRSVGTGKGKRYWSVASEKSTKTGSGSDAHSMTVDVDWLGKAALEIRHLVMQPVSKRRPVGYDPTFLKSYEPNTTYYLPNSILIFRL